MFNFYLIIARRNFNKTPNFHSRFIHKISLEKEKPSDEKDSSLTISYLINKCRLSHQSALSATKKINIKTTDNPDFVIDTLKSYNFTNNQITKLVTKYPQLLLSNMNLIMKPKLDYYITLGYSRTELGEFVSKNPGLIMSSLEKKVKPNVEILRSLLGSDQKVIDVINRSSRLLQYDLTTNFSPNVKTLESYGVSHANIAKLISLNPSVSMHDSDKFAQTVKYVKELGFNPLSTLFIKAVIVMLGLTPMSWEKKMEVYKSLGISEKDVITAFLKHPHCMALSEDKIRRAVDFYAKELHWEPSFVVARPLLLCFSLEKRLLPRCSVMSVLASKGFIKKYPSEHYPFLMLSETNFLKQYVIKYKNQVPEVLDVFKLKTEVV